MIKPIIKYPTIPSKSFDGVVRHYDDSLYTLLQDLKDTIKANNLDGLAAYQIGSPFTVIVIKEKNGNFLEIINPVIITKEGSLTPLETTAYYPNLTATTKRHQKIKLMYEDRNGKQYFLTAEDNLAILIQRKTDYLLGSDFRIRMNEEELKLFESKLEGGTDNIISNSCPVEPTFSKTILSVITLFLIVGAIGVVLGLFVSNTFAESLFTMEKYLMLFITISLILYFFIARYEGKKYTNCTSCQMGNIVGTIFLQTIRLLLLLLTSYFVFW